MRPLHSQGQIRPKISTMPRQKTEASAYLEIYKLVNEKKRLQQELEALGQRRDRITQRLEVLEKQVANLEKSAHDLRDSEPVTPQPKAQAKPHEAGSHNTMFLEY